MKFQAIKQYLFTILIMGIVTSSTAGQKQKSILPSATTVGAVVAEGIGGYVLGANKDLRDWLWSHPKQVGQGAVVGTGLMAALWAYDHVTAKPKKTKQSVVTGDPSSLPTVGGLQNNFLDQNIQDNYSVQGLNTYKDTDWSFSEKCAASVIGIGFAGAFTYAFTRDIIKESVAQNKDAIIKGTIGTSISAFVLGSCFYLWKKRSAKAAQSFPMPTPYVPNNSAQGQAVSGPTSTTYAQVPGSGNQSQPVAQGYPIYPDQTFYVPIAQNQAALGPTSTTYAQMPGSGNQTQPVAQSYPLYPDQIGSGNYQALTAYGSGEPYVSLGQPLLQSPYTTGDVNAGQNRVFNDSPIGSSQTSTMQFDAEAHD